MDFYYFSLLEIPVSFFPDLIQVRKNYYKLSRETHPDFFSGSEAHDMELKIRRSGDINTAYQILMDENLRTKYLLENYGVLKADESASFDQGFLMEMMDINEAIQEIDPTSDKEKLASITDAVTVIENNFKKEMLEKMKNFENQDNKELTLKDIKDIYLKMKYLLRIRENIGNFARSS